MGTYLSEPLVRAYTTAAAAHAVVAQLKYIFGVSPTRFTGPLSLVYVSTVKYLSLISILFFKYNNTDLLALFITTILADYDKDLGGVHSHIQWIIEGKI